MAAEVDRAPNVCCLRGTLFLPDRIIVLLVAWRYLVFRGRGKIDSPCGGILRKRDGTTSILLLRRGNGPRLSSLLTGRKLLRVLFFGKVRVSHCFFCSQRSETARVTLWWLRRRTASKSHLWHKEESARYSPVSSVPRHPRELVRGDRESQVCPVTG